MYILVFLISQLTIQVIGKRSLGKRSLVERVDFIYFIINKKVNQGKLSHIFLVLIICLFQVVSYKMR